MVRWTGATGDGGSAPRDGPLETDRPVCRQRSPLLPWSAGPAAHAQYRIEYNYCDRLQAQYEGALQRAGDSGVSGRTMVQMDKISGQLVQAQQAARQYGCTGGFLFFGPARARNARRSWRRSTG